MQIYQFSVRVNSISTNYYFEYLCFGISNYLLIGANGTDYVITVLDYNNFALLIVNTAGFLGCVGNLLVILSNFTYHCEFLVLKILIPGVISIAKHLQHQTNLSLLMNYVSLQIFIL